jgi:hypothetical protein
MDASSDAGGDRCPATQPIEGYDCYGDNAIGRICPYGATTCVCKNLGQNSAQWSCVPLDGGGASDAGTDAAPPDCTYDDGGAQLDPSTRFHGSCAGGCPAGTLCAVEIGGVAGGGGEYCAPIIDRCKNDLSCGCLASCVCGVSFSRPEGCTEGQPLGTKLECDNGIR